VDHPPEVLIVDDFALGRTLAERQLRRAGYAVTAASSGEEALELARRRPPDAIVSDIRMPGMSGLDLLEAIRRDITLAHVPFLIVAGAIDDDERQRATSLDATCLDRSSDMREALHALAVALHLTEPLDEPPAA
jgi:CheY-like chemotaxis protein